jgi:hypothetical protein
MRVRVVEGPALHNLSALCASSKRLKVLGVGACYMVRPANVLAVPAHTTPMPWTVDQVCATA